MNSNLYSIIDAFAGLNLLVIGEGILDSYLEGFSERLCQEAPVPVVTLSDRKDVPGGAANTAVNVRSLGAEVKLISVIGDDLEGNLLRQALSDRGVSTEYLLTEKFRSTLAKHRVISSGQMVVRFDRGSTNSIDGKTEEKLINYLIKLFPQSDAVIISDYGYGILTPRVIDAIANFQASFPRIVVVDSKNLAPYHKVGVTAVKPNYREAMRLLAESELENNQIRVSNIIRNRNRILELTGAEIAAVTLDTEGAVILERASPPYRTFAPPFSNAYVAGAGDTFISAFTACLVLNATLPLAAELASAAAAIVVAKEGTAACSAQELQEYIWMGEQYLNRVANLTNKKNSAREVA